MNLTKCGNGHYYDADKYSSCPHCSTNEEQDGDVTVNMEQTGSFGGRTEAVSQTGQALQAGLAGQSVTAGQRPGQDKLRTVSLADAVHVAAAPAASAPDEDKTVSYYGGSMGIEPVVGWLVCVEGEMLGKAYELKNGKNFIGRASSMDVVLDGDQNVSRERHAVVVYEPKGRVFIAQPGESRELFYMNDQVVLMNVEMHARDVLSVGKTKLMFIPLCGPDFSWEEMS